MIVGVSWIGGELLIIKESPSQLISSKNYAAIPQQRFVSLQYGQSKDIVDQWRKEGIDILHDDSINFEEHGSLDIPGSSL